MRYLYPPEPRPTIAQKAKESQSVTLFAAFPVEILNVSLVPVADLGEGPLLRSAGDRLASQAAGASRSGVD